MEDPSKHGPQTSSDMTGSRKRGADKPFHSSEDNPFETREIIRKKHNVFNRKSKGEKRNVARARGQATKRREKTLLVDYERSHKANSFRDRRFGEDDASLLLEEKMWARMQNEHKKRNRRMEAFHLGEDGDEGEVLTHKGQVLGKDYQYQYRDESNDGQDDELDAEVVNRLHFGGGSEAHGDLPPSQLQGGKTRHELLNDMIARSKERKLEKARGKEEQESERERLDEGMSELLAMLNQRPTKGERRIGSESDDYDQTMRELIYEARAQATDRLQTPQEAARAEKARLEELEKARIERMENQANGLEMAVCKRRTWQGPNDDELHDEGVAGLISGTAAGRGDSDTPDSDDDLAPEASSRNTKSSSHCDDIDGWSDSDTEVNKGESEIKMLKHPPVREELPYVFGCPSSYEGLLVLLAEHATSAEEINMILDRIHKNHSIKLASNNKEKMHNFYEVLLKRFRRVGAQTAKLSRERQDREKQLNFLTGLIYDITEEMPEVASSLWHRFMGNLHHRMVKSLNDLSTNAPTSGCWPGIGSLLLLKLSIHIFPHTDFRHPVVTPVMIHLSQCLSQCPVKTSSDLGAGIFSCTLILHCSLGAGRVPPEALVFVSSALTQFSPSGSKQGVASPAFKSSNLHWLRVAAASYTGDDIPDFNMDAIMTEVLTPSSRHEFAVGVLASLFQLALEIVQGLQGNVACSELLSSVQSALTKVEPQANPSLPECLIELHTSVSGQIAAATEECISTRRPVMTHILEEGPSMHALVPKFEESYKMKKDGHKDVEQTKLKQLQRQVKRERKGAMRELKRDAMFLEYAKTEKKKEKEQTRKRRLRENLTWLEEQQATLNQQVKLGGKLVKGGGSSSTKRARIGRGY